MSFPRSYDSIWGPAAPPEEPRSIADIEASINWHRIMRTQNAEIFADLEAELRIARAQMMRRMII